MSETKTLSIMKLKILYLKMNMNMKISLLSTDVLFASEINQIRVRETSSISTDFLLHIRALSDLKLWFTLYSILS